MPKSPDNFSYLVRILSADGTDDRDIFVMSAAASITELSMPSIRELMEDDERVMSIECMGDAIEIPVHVQPSISPIGRVARSGPARVDGS